MVWPSYSPRRSVIASSHKKGEGGPFAPRMTHMLLRLLALHVLSHARKMAP
jgi:hypothetical protein